jgi:hypothetical protein
MTPITKEILSKSGWVTNSGCCYLNLPDNVYLSWHFNKTFYLVITNTDTDSDCEELSTKLDIEFIEQLEALYKLLTNQPLNIVI